MSARKTKTTRQKKEPGEMKGLPLMKNGTVMMARIKAGSSEVRKALPVLEQGLKNADPLVRMFARNVLDDVKRISNQA